LKTLTQELQGRLARQFGQLAPSAAHALFQMVLHMVAQLQKRQTQRLAGQVQFMRLPAAAEHHQSPSLSTHPSGISDFGGPQAQHQTL
jgi:hypothetical protein